MQRESGFAWLIAAVALALAMTGGAPKAKQAQVSEGTAPADAAPAGDNRCEAQAAAVLSDFFAAAGPSDLDGGRYSLRIVVATVPDPIDSLLDHVFDRKLEAIQRAVAAHGFAQDRFWLPWAYDREHPTAPGDECRTTTPGAMLFRRTADKVDAQRPYGLADGLRMDLLLVLLVGETPTAGVARKAFAAALDMVERYQPERDRIDLLGPSFSGSSPSLRQVIDAWDRNYLHSFRFISGSATSPTNKEFLTAASGMMSFHATVLPDDVVMRHVLDKALQQSFHAEPAQVALLSESSTAYGLAVSGSPDREFSPGLLLQFPLHISQLRASDAASDSSPASPQPQTGPGAQAPQRKTDAPTPREVIPLMSPYSTQYDGIGLARVLGTLSSEHVRFVVLSSTDIRDKVFIARKLHEYTPDVRMIVLQSDAILADRQYRQFLNGTIMASTYPLDGANQAFTATSLNGVPDDRRLQFSTDGAEGDYNAAIAILNEQSRELDKEKAAQVPLLEYGLPLAAPQDSQWPPVWLSLVYDGQIVPLGVEAVEDAHDYVYKARMEGARAPAVVVTPGAWKLAFSLLMLLFAGCALYSRKLFRDGVRVANRAMVAFAWLGCFIFGLPAVLGPAVFLLSAAAPVRIGIADWTLFFCWAFVVATPTIWMATEVAGVLRSAPAAPGVSLQAGGDGAVVAGMPPEDRPRLRALWSSHDARLSSAASIGSIALMVAAYLIVALGHTASSITAAHALVVFRRVTSAGSITNFLALLMLLLCFFCFSLGKGAVHWKRVGTPDNAPPVPSIATCWRAHWVLMAMCGLALLATVEVGRRASTPENFGVDLVAFAAILLAGASIVFAMYAQLAGGGVMLSHLDRLATKHVLHVLDGFHQRHPESSRTLRAQLVTGIVDIQAQALAPPRSRAYAKEWLFSSAWPSPEHARADRARGGDEGLPEPDALALEVAASVGEFAGMVKWSVCGALIGNLFFLFALDLTPIQPHRLLLLLSWSYLITTTVVLGRLLFRLNRDPVLAALASRKQGLVALDWSLALRLAPVIAMLVLNLIAAQFPLQFGDMDGGLVQSILRTLK